MTDAETEKRFEGAGQEFHAKYMGSVEVTKSKGQEVCQEAMQKLLVALKSRKEPKPRLIINLSYEGTHLKEMPPGINLLEMTFKHSQVAYVWKDPRDQRSLGIVRTEADPEDSTKLVHKFHGIRTIKPAMPFLQDMQELFRIVKERSAQQKDRAASVAATTASAVPTEGAPAPQATTAAAEAASANQQPAADLRDRAVSNLLGDAPDPSGPGMTKNASVASLDDLGDIFSASASINQQSLPAPNNHQPMTGGPFGQPIGGSPFGQLPVSPFGQPMPGGPFGQPIGVNPYAQPMAGGGGQFGQQFVVGGGAFGQPMPGAQYRQPQPAVSTNPFGQQAQPMVGAYPYGGAYAPRSPMPFGQPQQPPPPPIYQQQYSYPPQQLQQQQQQQQQPRQPVSTNPFDSGFSSVFDRQNSAQAGGPEDLLTPVTLNPVQVNAAAAAVKPDAFSDLVVGLSATGDPKRQQVSGKDLFKPTDKPKTTLRDMANPSQRP